MNDSVINQIGYSAGYLPWAMVAMMLVFIPAAWWRKRKFVPLSVLPAALSIGIALVRVPMPFFMIASIFPFMAVLALIVSLGGGTVRGANGAQLATTWPAFIPILFLPAMMAPSLFSSRHDTTVFFRHDVLSYVGTRSGRIDRDKVQVRYSGSGPVFWMISDGGKNEFFLSSNDVFDDLRDGSDVAKQIAQWAGVTPTPAE